MSFLQAAGLAAVLAIGCAAALGEDVVKIPPGTPVTPADVTKFNFSGGSDKNATWAGIDLEGQATKGARVTITKRPENFWAVQIAAPTTEAVAKGDLLLAVARIRCESSPRETGDAEVHLVFEQNAAPHEKSLGVPVLVPKTWTTFYFPFVARQDFPAGKASANIQLGTQVQTLDIASYQVINYGKTLKMSDLPRTKATYAGREADAPWRKAALQRIDQIRKEDLTIKVIGADGKPVNGAAVDVKMVRHAFAFGSAVAADALLGDKPDNEQYRQHVKRLFNRVVMENDLKWGGWEGNRQRAINGVKWLRDNNIEVRGHNLIWPGWRNMPKDTQALASDPEKLRKRINDHIADEATAMKGQLVEWDVINEPFSNKDVMKVLGDEEMVAWFKLARQCDPQAVLFLNDYPILSSNSSAHLDHFAKTIQFLIDKGAPIGGIGVQCHYGYNVPSPAQFLAGADRFAKFKLPIALTEFDINVTDDAFQADYMRDSLIAALSHPAIDSVIMWGFWEGRHWLPNAALYKKDWTIKPVGQAWEDLVLKQWMTAAKLQTDGSGTAGLRGFLGDYEITVTSGQSSKTVKAKLAKGSATVEIKLP